jgi:hypothetical protein
MRVSLPRGLIGPCTAPAAVSGRGLVTFVSDHPRSAATGGNQISFGQHHEQASSGPRRCECAGATSASTLQPLAAG